MKTADHVIKSFRQINDQNPEFLKENWSVLQPLIWQLHFWLDYFSGRPDYETVYTVFYHREQRHHQEGICEGVSHFVSLYGLKFRSIIREELTRHVRDDFGEIPAQAECTRRYLREKRGW